MSIIAKCMIALSTIEENNGRPPTISNFLNTDFQNHQLALVDFNCTQSTDLEGSGEEEGSGCQEGAICLDFYKCFELFCNAEGKPMPNIKWYHNNLQISNTTNNFEIVDSTKNLQFFSVDSEQPDETLAGSYYCEAVNEHGTARSEVLFIFQDDGEGRAPLEFVPKIKELKSNLVPFLSRETLTCAIENDVPYTTTWTKDGKEITTNVKMLTKDGNEITENIKIQDDSLVIESFDISSQGTYACNVSNEHGYDYRNVFLSVLKEEPEFIAEPLSQETNTATSLWLNCLVKGYPIPDVIWKFQNDAESPGTIVSKIDGICTDFQLEQGLIDQCKKITVEEKFEETPEGKLVSSDLKIDDVEITDSGRYHCEATNHITIKSGKIILFL